MVIVLFLPCFGIEYNHDYCNRGNRPESPKFATLGNTERDMARFRKPDIFVSRSIANHSAADSSHICG